RPMLTSVHQHNIKDVEQIPEESIIVHTRNKFDCAKGHTPTSINIQNNKSLANWAGWMLPYDKPLVIIAEAPLHEEITRKLMRIGMDNIEAFVQIGRAHV